MRTMYTHLNPIPSLSIALLLAGSALTACRNTHGTQERDARASVSLAASVASGVASSDTNASSSPSEAYSVYDLQSAWRDQRGDTLTLRDLRGRVQLVAMVYTNCQVTCPLIVGALKRIESSLPLSSRDRVGFVLVSLDPMRDTPGRLSSWAASTKLDTAHWTLLSGSDDAVRELAATLDVRYQGQADGEVAHTNGITMLDTQGAIAHQQLTLDDTDATLRTLRALLR